MGEVDLNQGMRCIKFLLIIFNMMFVITGVLVISVGFTIQYVYYSFDDFLEESFLSPAILLYVVGVIIFVVAFFGCCGAAKESTCMIMVFSVLLGLIFVLELSAAIAGSVMANEVRAGIWSKINETTYEYTSSIEAAETMDFMHEALGCCGVDGPSDWTHLLKESNDTVLVNNSYYVPNSCCAIYYEDDAGLISNAPDGPKCQFIYGSGCARRLEYVVKRSAVTLTSAAICLALLQLLGVVFACTLGKTIRHQKTERERRRWELREKLINSYTAPKTTYPVVYLSPSADFDC